MATWKKVIVSGSAANVTTLQVDNLTSGQVVIGGGTGNLSSTAINGTGNIVATTGATGVVMTGSFTGSFVGNGAGLTGVTATAIFPTSQVSNITSTDKFFISQSTNQYITYGDLLTDLAGTNLAVESSDSLTLASTITGLTSVSATSFTGSLLGTATTASYVLNAISSSYALNSTNATTAATASTVTVTDTTTGGTHYLSFTAGTSGAQTLRVDSNGPTVNPSANSISATSFTGSLLGTATTASYVLNAVSASFATTAATATTASYVLNAVSASLATAVSSIASNVTNNTNNYLLTATGGGSINGESNLQFDGTTLTVTGNQVLTGNLTVQGTASFQNTTNLEVADRFVLFASGSNTAGDGGIVVQQATQNVGELFGYENSINRWGFTSSFAANSPSFTAAAMVTTTETSTSSPSAAPVYGGASNGFGNIHVNTSTGDIFIYS
jgi:hypothetical protein